jgi:hypothetical protein
MTKERTILPETTQGNLLYFRTESMITERQIDFISCDFKMSNS